MDISSGLNFSSQGVSAADNFAMPVNFFTLNGFKFPVPVVDEVLLLVAVVTLLIHMVVRRNLKRTIKIVMPHVLGKI